MTKNNLDYLSYQVEFYVYGIKEKFTADVVSIFNENEDFYYGVCFGKNNDVVGVKIDDIEWIKKLKKINYQIEAAPITKEVFKNNTFN